MTILFQVLAASIGTIAFCVMYNVSARHFIYCGICGAAGWLAFLLLQNLSPVFGIFAGALIVVFLSRLFSVIRECPITIFLLPGIFPLVPGKGIYYTVYYAIMHDYHNAAESFFNAFSYSFAIALAISIGTMIRADVFHKLKRKAVHL